MSQEKKAPLSTLLGLRFQAHPWHGVAIGPEAPTKVTAYIEIVPTDTVKYELDKVTGLLSIDRPQRYSNVCPSLYGLLPQTYCGDQVAELCAQRTGLKDIIGDGDPLDICVFTEKSITHGNVLVRVIPIGGLRMLDDREADDKILAVLEGDATYGAWNDITECPQPILKRLEHYFLTYKDVPGSPRTHCKLDHVYGREEAHDVIRRSQEDYRAQFGDLEEQLALVLRGEKGRK